MEALFRQLSIDSAAYLLAWSFLSSHHDQAWRGLGVHMVVAFVLHAATSVRYWLTATGICNQLLCGRPSGVAA